MPPRMGGAGIVVIGVRGAVWGGIALMLAAA
jgi:hypothetical protein